MKIILTLKELTKAVGGAERSLCELANELYDRGHHVLVVNFEKNTLINCRPFYHLNDDIQMKNIWHKQGGGRSHNLINNIKLFIIRVFQIKKSSDEYILKVLIFYFGVDTKVINNKLRPLFSKLYSFFTGKSFNQNSKEPDNNQKDKMKQWMQVNKSEITAWREAILQENPDLVIAFHPWTFVYIAQVLKNSSIPFITANRTDPYHNSRMYHNDDTFLNYLIHDAVRLALANIVLAESFRPYFEEKNPGKTWVIPNPIYTAKEIKPNKLSPEDSVNTIISIGRLSHPKNQAVLIKAFYKINHKYKNWRLTIYGQNDGYKARLLYLIDELELNNQVFLFDPIKNINNKLLEADIFVLTSLYEGFSRALGEAMSYGLPSVVIEDCTSNAELIRKGNCGLIARNEAEDISNKLESLVINPDLRNELGENGKRFADSYAPKKIYDMWEELILMALK